MRRVVPLLCSLAMIASACRGTIIDSVPIDARLPGAPECRDTIGAITLTALGDFPTTDLDVVQLDGSGAPIAPVTRLPIYAGAFSMSAHASTAGWEAFGWATRDSLAIDSALTMRPIGLSCPIADPEARVPRGAAVAVIDEGRVMIVGGFDDADAATRRVAFLDVRQERVDLPRMDHAFEIVFAAAALVPEGDAVLVTGGTARDGGDPLPTWERIPFDGGPLRFGTIAHARRDHAALAVDGGGVHGVLLVGGSDGGHALASIEWIDADAGAGAPLDAHLMDARITPQLVSLDATHVAIVGGTDDHGAVVTSIEVLDLALDACRTLPSTLGPPDWIAMLPSGRVAWASSGALSIVTIPASAPDALRVDDAGTVPAVTSPVAVALANGRIALEGARVDGTRAAFLIDPGAGSVTSVPSSRIPQTMIAMSDGSTLELARTGGSVRRDDRLTPFDSPPPSFLFATDSASLALDAASRWSVTGSALTPLSNGARLDVPTLRFGHFEALFDASGAYDIVLTGEHLEPLVTAQVTDDSVTLGACSFARTAEDGRVRILRGIPNDVLVDTEHGSHGCEQTETTLRVGIGVIAHTGAALRSLALQRDLLVH